MALAEVMAMVVVCMETKSVEGMRGGAEEAEAMALVASEVVG